VTTTIQLLRDHRRQVLVEKQPQVALIVR
jgi:hypothetical protein